MPKPYIDIQAGKYRDGDAVLEEGPGSEILGDVRKYLEYDSSKWIYLDTASGNNSNSGLTPLLPKLTASAAAALVDGTNYTVVHVINNGAVVTGNITKPFQMAHGMLGSIDVDIMANQGAWYNPVSKSTTLSATYSGMAYSPTLHRWLATNGGAGPSQSAYSDDDGSSWSTTSSIATFGPVGELQWLKDKFVGCWKNPSPPYNTYIKYSLDGITAPISVTVPGSFGMPIRHGAYSPTLDRFVFVGDDGMYVGSDVTSLSPVAGYAPNSSSNPSSYANFQLFKVIWSNYLKVFIAVGKTNPFTTEPLLLKSTDGFVWEEVTGYTTAGNTLQTIAEGKEGIIAITCFGGGNDIIYTKDLVNFTTVTATNRPTGKFMFSWRYDAWIGYDALFGGIIISKNLLDWNYAYTSNLVYFDCAPLGSQSKKVHMFRGNSNIYYEVGTEGITISDDVAGFYLGEVKYSSTPTLKNCSRHALVLTGETFISCRSSCLKVDADAFQGKKNLCRSDMYWSGDPAAQDDVDFENNLIGGNLNIGNANETYYEKFSENVILGSVIAAEKVLITGGVVKGGVTNCILDKVSDDDPGLVDEIDFVPKREINGYPADSLMVAASEIEVNSTGIARDIGPWSYREANVVFKFRRHFKMLKPSQKDSVKFIRHNLTSSNPTANGTPSVVNIPSAAWEEIFLTYGSLNTEDKGSLRNQFEFVDFMHGQELMDVFISWDGIDAIISSITLDGAASAGDLFITVDEDDVEPGTKFMWFGIVYTILRVSGNRLVLDQDLVDAIPDAAEIDLVSPVGYGYYRFVPEKDTVLSLNHFAQSDYKRGLTLRFARACVSQS